jgi:MFS family permease
MDSFGVFVKPFISEFAWSRWMISASYSLSFLIFGFVGILMGGLTDRFGPRVILTCCGLFLGLGYLLMSQLNALWQLYLFQGVIVGVGMSALYAPVLSLIARWFVRRRGSMTGLALSGMGIGQLVAPPIISRLIALYDWRYTYIFLGITVIVVVVLATQFLKRDPVAIGQVPYGDRKNDGHATQPADRGYSLLEAARIFPFWGVVFIKFCYGYYMFSVVVHIIPHVTDLGFSAVDAANILAVSGAAIVVGSFALGRAGDWIGPRQVFIICFIVALVSLLWLTQSGAMWMLYIFAAVIGLANGGNVVSDSPLVARLFGLNAMGAIVGVSSCAFSIGAALGPVITGYIFDSTGSYKTAFLVGAALCVSGLVITSMIRPTKRLRIKI